jgi:trehalose 6-phosphate phosphatase
VSGENLEGAFNSTRKWLEALSVVTQRYRRNRLWIEDKKYSLSIHYREVKSSPQFTSLIAEIRSLAPEARFVLGKRVINLVPNGLPNKLDALHDLMRTLSRGRAFFIGDDVTDEVVFLDKSPDIFSVKVGFDSPLSASYYLHKQEDIECLLDFFLAAVDHN